MQLEKQSPGITTLSPFAIPDSSISACISLECLLAIYVAATVPIDLPQMIILSPGYAVLTY